MRIMQYRKGLASREATKTKKFPDCVGTNVFKGDCPATLEGIETIEQVHSCVICPFGGRELIEKWIERKSRPLPKQKKKTAPPAGETTTPSQ